MAATSIRTTYALDAETVERLERLARHWSLSKSATLRKLIRDAAQPEAEERLAAWRELQHSMAGLSPEQAKAWVSDIRSERRAATRRMTGRRR